MVPGGTDANPTRERGSCTLTHGCIGPTRLFHINQLRLLYRQDAKIGVFCYIQILIGGLPILECPGWDPCTDLWFVNQASGKLCTLKLLVWGGFFWSQGLRIFHQGASISTISKPPLHTLLHLANSQRAEKKNKTKNNLCSISGHFHRMSDVFMVEKPLRGQ